MKPGNTLESPKGVYKIIKWLGEGGFGEVYLTDYTAKNASNSEQVALKKIAFRGMSEEECKKEAELMEKISKSSTNQHIVKYLGSFIGKVHTSGLFSCIVGTISPSHRSLYIAMDYYSCGDLKSKIETNISLRKEFDPEIVYNYIYQIADGINELHVKYKAIHRDLKPANILIAWENGKEVLKISDFGLAKMLDTLNMSLHTVCGTPLYMAPEQRSGRYKSPVDIWAIGIIFYELCISPKKLTNEIEDLWEKIGNSQRDTTWLNRMIAKDPDKRMSSDQVRDEAISPDPPEWREDASVTYFKDKLYYLGGWNPNKAGEKTNRVDLLMGKIVIRCIDYQTMNGNGLKLERFQKNKITLESHR
ncbi:hypothetical protein WR25_25208 [Diploscapter pachys]|uniref:Protein kinase domain-containing protein n=1 Tax=Diploscapter pachys TaxID=2018661 RepID=A0A2A2LF88_9BILA|nr:hypothetical protein WR25_25208 [Diploscapter pachys]